MSSKLFKEFPRISSKEWKDKVIADLKGADFEKKLVWRTSEGFNVLPYYTHEDLEGKVNAVANTASFPYIRGNDQDNNWQIRQNFLVADPAMVNKQAIEALAKGANVLGFDMSGTTSIYPKLITYLLSGIDVATTCLNFTALKDPARFYEELIHYLESENINPADLKGSLGIDTLGELSLTGEENDIGPETLSNLVKKASQSSPGFRIIGVNASIFQDGGASLTQELGFGLALANDYMDQLTSSGCTAEQAMRSILFTFATGPNYFMEIAKLRSARWLWSVICKEWGIPEEQIKMTIHSQTAKWNHTVYDPYVNVLRSTTEAMSASLAGADVISIHPHDTTFKQENDFSARIARNLQIILKEEAYFDKVADPASGSYYIETLTDQIAEQAWNLFQELEISGGYRQAFKNGTIQDRILESLTAKKQKAAARRDSILGVNQYPNFNEMILDQLEPQSNAVPGTTSYKPITQYRISEDFEALRLQTEKSGKRPKVFLLKYGDPVWMTARAMFAGNFFAVAGYEIIDTPGFETLEKGIEAARNSEAEIVVLCSSDKAYAEIEDSVIQKLVDKTEIVIAGYPKDSIEDLKSAGIKSFIHVRSNILDVLTEFNKLLDIN